MLRARSHCEECPTQGQSKFVQQLVDVENKAVSHALSTFATMSAKQKWTWHNRDTSNATEERVHRGLALRAMRTCWRGLRHLHTRSTKARAVFANAGRRGIDLVVHVDDLDHTRAKRWCNATLVDDQRFCGAGPRPSEHRPYIQARQRHPRLNRDPISLIAGYQGA
jgi:hypothetical protein